MGNQCAHGVRPAFSAQIPSAVQRVESRPPQCGRVADVVKPTRGDDRVHHGGWNRHAQCLSPPCHRGQVEEAIGVLAHDARGEIASLGDERLGHSELKFTPEAAAHRNSLTRSTTDTANILLMWGRMPKISLSRVATK